MSLHGWQVPCGKRPEDAERRREVFDIAAKYCMSVEDIQTVAQSPEKMQDLWFESFANSNKILVHESLQKNAKSYFLRFFPSFGGAASRGLGAMLGLESGQTILDR